MIARAKAQTVMRLFCLQEEVREMTEQEKLAFELKIREKIAEENRAKRRESKARWREKNREYLRNYARAYRVRKKMCGEVRTDE